MDKSKTLEEIKKQSECEYPVDEAYAMYEASKSLKNLFQQINHASSWWELFVARRSAELVIADTIKHLNSTLEDMLQKYPGLEISGYEGLVEVPYLAIN